MFLGNDGIDKQLERLVRSNSSRCHSWSSFSTAESSSEGPNGHHTSKVGPSDVMIQALIRDLSFWDAIPPTSQSSFPSPLPKRPENVGQWQRQSQHQSEPGLRRGRDASSRDPEGPEEHFQRLQKRRSSNSRSGQSSSSHGNLNSKGTIDDLSSSNSSWRPLPPPVWKAAVDPMTGRTYYYDSVTRRTQWEKPAEVRQYEKQKKALKKKRDRMFFKEMEQNIMKSISRGEKIPGVPEAQNPGPPLEPRNAKTPLRGSNVRTLSRMDDTILAELRDDVVSPEEFDRAIQAQRTRPRSSSIGRPPLPGTTHSSNSDERNSSQSVPQRQGLDSSSGGEIKEGSARQQKSSLKKDGNTRMPKRRSVTLNVPDKAVPKGDHPLAKAALAEEDVVIDGALQAEIQSLADKADPVPTNKNHVRRNTGGTIYVNGTMSNPNVEATIKCVCGVYRAHLVQAAEGGNGTDKSPVSVLNKPLDTEVFNDRYHLPNSYKGNLKQDALPSLPDIIHFYQEFYKRSQMEFDTIIMSLIYVERLIKTTNLVPGPENWRSVLFSCMVLASKVWDDLSMWNIDFSNVASSHTQGMSLFTLQRVNQLELILLKSLNFDVRVPASEYAKYYFLIRTMLLRSGLLEGAAKPLGKEEAKVLENRTSHYQDSKLGGGQQHERRSQSMYDYSWLEKGSQPEEGADPTGDEPVLKDKVCLEEIVNM